MPHFSARLDFPSSPLSAPGSPRMGSSQKKGLKSNHGRQYWPFLQGGGGGVQENENAIFGGDVMH